MSEENNKDIKEQKSVDVNSEEVVDNKEKKEKKEENEGKKEESSNNIQIANDVVASIAGMAASSVPGVAEMAGGFAGGISEVLSGKKNMSKGIKVDVTDNNVKIDVNIIVEYGSRIPDVAFEIQKRVKKAVENMTGFTTTEVNVHVQGVLTAKEVESKKSENKKEDKKDEKNVEDEKTEKSTKKELKKETKKSSTKGN